MKNGAKAIVGRTNDEADCSKAQMERAAREAGRKWAAGYREALLQDRRVPTGGWPGTLTEARAVASKCLYIGGSPSTRRGLTVNEQEQFARLINASARRDWLNSAGREAPEPIEEME